MKYSVLILIILLCSCSGNIDKSKLNSMDYRLFEGTNAEQLAKAVENGDVKAIKKRY